MGKLEFTEVPEEGLEEVIKLEYDVFNARGFIDEESQNEKNGHCISYYKKFSDRSLFYGVYNNNGNNKELVAWSRIIFPSKGVLDDFRERKRNYANSQIYQGNEGNNKKISRKCFQTTSDFEVFGQYRKLIYDEIKQNEIIEIGTIGPKEANLDGIRALRLLNAGMIHELHEIGGFDYAIASIDEKAKGFFKDKFYPGMLEIGEKKYYMGSNTIPILIGFRDYEPTKAIRKYFDEVRAK